VVELYPTREKAEIVLAEMLLDEPDWHEVLVVVPEILGVSAATVARIEVGGRQAARVHVPHRRPAVRVDDTPLVTAA
jgi:hypothetical protein